MHSDDKDLQIPEPDAQFEQRIWAKVSAEMATRPGISHKFLWILVPAALALAFFVGRSTRSPEIFYLPQQQLLQAATSEHLERSKLVLMETANGAAPLAQARAEQLLSTNRLLRRGAQQAGELEAAELLEELERVLLEVAHSSETMQPEESAALRARIREQGLLFRVRLLENKNKQNTESAD